MKTARVSWNFKSLIDPESVSSSWRTFFLLSGLFLALLQLFEHVGIAAAFYGLFMLGGVLLIAKPKIGVLYYISVCILSTDTPFINAPSPLVSIHTVGFGGMALMPLWTASLLLFLILYLMHRGVPVKYNKQFGKIVLHLGGLFLIAAAIGSFNFLKAPRIYISDASYYINMATVYLAIRIFFRQEKDLKLLISVFVSCLAVRAIAGILFYFLGIGEVGSFIVKPVLDSSRVLFPLLVLLGFAAYYTPGIRNDLKKAMLFFAFAGIFNVLTYASRGNMFLLAFGLLLLFFLMRKPRSKGIGIVQKTKKIILPTVFLVIATLIIMHQLRPGSLNYITWKLASTIEVGDRADISSANVRWLEAQNIVAYLWQNGNILWGEGLGGYFIDSYKPYAIYTIGKDAYQYDWIVNGTLYKPHGSQLFFLLKMGVVGSILYFTLLILFFIRSCKKLRLDLPDYWRAILAACVAFLPLLIYKNFNSKLQISMGIVLAIIVNIITIQQNLGYKEVAE